MGSTIKTPEITQLKLIPSGGYTNYFFVRSAFFTYLNLDKSSVLEQAKLDLYSLQGL